jgi:hypothetical protein
MMCKITHLPSSISCVHRNGALSPFTVVVPLRRFRLSQPFKPIFTSRFILAVIFLQVIVVSLPIPSGSSSLDYPLLLPRLLEEVSGGYPHSFPKFHLHIPSSPSMQRKYSPRKILIIYIPSIQVNIHTNLS